MNNVHHRTGKSLQLKVLSVVTLFTFLGSLVTPLPVAEAATPVVAPNKALFGLKIPENMGSIQDKRILDEKSPLVIHLQNAHANYGAQKNIAKILEYLQNQFQIENIYLEGSAGEADVSLYRSVPLKEKRDEIIDEFVREGRVTGAESYGITSQNPVQLFGVDNEFLYIENVKTYIQTLEIQEKASPLFTELESAIAKLEKKIYSPELLQFVRATESLLEKPEGSLEYMRSLFDTVATYKISIDNLPTLKQIKEIEVYQDKINLSQVAHETQTLVDKLLMGNLSDDETQQLAFKEMDIKAKRISMLEFLSFLKKLSDKEKIDFRSFINLNLYLNYLLLAEKIDAKKLNQDREKVEKKIYEAALDSTDAKTLHKLKTNLTLLKNLFSLKATPEDIAYFKKNKIALTNQSFLSFLKKHNRKIENTDFLIEENLSIFERFYRLAEAREKYMVRNSLTEMKNKKLAASVLVTGGYHTPGIKQNFLKNKVSYYTITPRILEAPEGSDKDLYDQIMRSYAPYFGVKEGSRGGTVELISNIAALSDRNPLYTLKIDEFVKEFLGKILPHLSAGQVDELNRGAKGDILFEYEGEDGAPAVLHVKVADFVAFVRKALPEGGIEGADDALQQITNVYKRETTTPAFGRGNVAHRKRTDEAESVNAVIAQAYKESSFPISQATGADIKSKIGRILGELLTDEELQESLRRIPFFRDKTQKDVLRFFRGVNFQFPRIDNQDNSSPGLVLLNNENYVIAHPGGIRSPTPIIYMSSNLVMDAVFVEGGESLRKLALLSLRELAYVWVANELFHERTQGEGLSRERKDEIYEEVIVTAKKQADQVLQAVDPENTVADYIQGKVDEYYDSRVTGYNPETGEMKTVFHKDEKDRERLKQYDLIGEVEIDGETRLMEKYEGAFVVEDGDLLLPKSVKYPTKDDVPLGRLDLPRYVKIVPLAYHFMKNYLGDKNKYREELDSLADKLETTNIVLTNSVKPGKRPYSVNRRTKTITIEKDFMEYTLHMGMKRVTIALIVQALTELYPKDKSQAGKTSREKSLVNSIAQASVFTISRNRLEDSIRLYHLKQKIFREKRLLKPDEKKLFLVDQMERTHTFNGRQAQEALFNEFGFYGMTTPDGAETLMRQLVDEYPKVMKAQPFEAPPDDNPKEDPFTDRTDTFYLDPEYLADQDLLKGRALVWDFEVDARDQGLFGGKVVFTGMMQHVPGAATLASFASSGRAFKEKLIAANPGLDEEFKAMADELKAELNRTLENVKKIVAAEKGIPVERVTVEQAKNHVSYTQKYVALTENYSQRFKSRLQWKKANIDEGLQREIRENLRKLAERLEVPVRTLVLAIRSSALGEDSEGNSFAGRQDTALFVMVMNIMKILENKGVDTDQLKVDMQPSRELPWDTLWNFVLQAKAIDRKFKINEQYRGTSSAILVETLEFLIRNYRKAEKTNGSLKVFEALLPYFDELKREGINLKVKRATRKSGPLVLRKMEALLEFLNDYKERENPWNQLEKLVAEMERVNIPVNIDRSEWGKSVGPWTSVLKALMQELERQDKEMGEVTDDELDIFVEEWLANQRSLFNARSIDYRLQQNPPFPIYDDNVEMSSLFQVMGFFDIGLVGFGTNRGTGFPELEIGIIEGATNAIVSNKATTDNVFVRFNGEFRSYQVSDDRRTWQVPNVLGLERDVEGEMKLGGTVDLEFPEVLKGQPAITDWEQLGQLGDIAKTMKDYFGMYQDFEGGLIISRDAEGNPYYIPDDNQPDGIARDHAGNKRTAKTMVYTQVRPETVENKKNKKVIFLRYEDMSDEDVKELTARGLLLYGDENSRPIFHSQGASAAEVEYVDKDRPDLWHRAHKKSLVTIEGTPDLDVIMHAAANIITLIGGKQSHTAIMAMEFGWIVITGLPDINKLYPGRMITNLATRGLIFDGDHSDRFQIVGNDMDASALPLMPEGFQIGLNINSVGTGQKADALGAEWPSYYGSGLIRLEQLLTGVGSAPEALLRYDNYRYLSLLTKMDNEGLEVEDQVWLQKALRKHGELEGIRIEKVTPRRVKIKVKATGNQRTIKGPQFYDEFLKDPKLPPYDPSKKKDKEVIDAVEALVNQGFLNGEERYVEIISRGLEAMAETFQVNPQTFLSLAQQIEQTDVRDEAISLAETYIKARKQPAVSALEKLFHSMMGFYRTKRYPEDPKEYLEKLLALQERAEGVNDSFYLQMMIDHLQKYAFIRLDDRKSDELEKMLGSDVVRDTNPMAGYRGIRMMLDNPRLLKMQLRAIKKMVDKGRSLVRVFAPVVYDVDHVIELQRIFGEVGLDIKTVLFGIMSETPQAFEVREYLEKAGVSFFSVGGNDHLQFSKAVDRNMMGADYFNTLNNRAVSLIRMLATLANETKKHNIGKALKDRCTDGFCGDWPSNDPVGAVILYLLGFDSASLTLPNIEGAAEMIFTIFDVLSKVDTTPGVYGHREVGPQRFRQLILPRTEDGEIDREKIAQDLLTLIDSPSLHEGLPDEIQEILPALKLALHERHYNIYDEIDQAAAPDINQSYSSNSVDALHLSLPFHYRALEDYDNGKLDVTRAKGQITRKIGTLKKNAATLKKEFDEWVDRAKEDDDKAKKQVQVVAAKLNDVETEIRDLERDLESIELKKAIEKALRENEIPEGKRRGEKLYKKLLHEMLKPAALKALSRGETFFLEASNITSTRLKKKLGGARYELEKEANPFLGNRGMKKNLNPDLQIFVWSLQVLGSLKKDREVKSALADSQGKIGLTLRTVREIEEVRETRLLLTALGISKDDIELALGVDVADQQYYFDHFFEPQPVSEVPQIEKVNERQEVLAKAVRKRHSTDFMQSLFAAGMSDFGIRALIMTPEMQRQLAALKRGTEWDNKNTRRQDLDPLIDDDDVRKTLQSVSLPMTLTAADRYNVPLYLPKNAPVQLPNFYETELLSVVGRAALNKEDPSAVLPVLEGMTAYVRDAKNPEKAKAIIMPILESALDRELSKEDVVPLTNLVLVASYIELARATLGNLENFRAIVQHVRIEGLEARTPLIKITTLSDVLGYGAVGDPDDSIKLSRGVFDGIQIHVIEENLIGTTGNAIVDNKRQEDPMRLPQEFIAAA